MSIQEQKKWVVGAFVVIAAAMAVLFGLTVYRSSRRAATVADAEGMRELASLKEIAAALKDPARREDAVRALRKQKVVAAVDLLTALGNKNKDPDVRAAALTALGDIVDPEDMRGVQALTIGSRDEAPAVRMAALRALGQVATDMAYAAIADALTDMELEVRRTAAEVLSLGKGSSPTVDKLTEAFPEEQDVETRRLMALALGRMKDRTARRCVLAALGRGGEREAVVRLAAMESLGAWQDDYGAKGLAVGMCDPDGAVRERAKAFFVELDVSVLTNLTAALQSGKVRGALRGARGKATLDDMVDVLAALNAPETAEPLIQILDVSVGTRDRPLHPSIRDRAVAQLAAVGEPATGVLAGAVLKPEVRLALKAAAAEAFIGVGSVAVAPIRAYIESRKVLPSSDEARLCIRTLERIGGAEAAEAAVEAKARDPQEVFRRYAEALPPVSTNRPPAPQVGEWSLVLYKGMYGGNPPSAYTRRKDSLPFVKNRSVGETEIPEYRPTSGCDVALDLVRTRDGWARCQGHSHMFNHVVFGKVDRLEMTDEAAEGELRVNVYRDPWMVGGYGEYRVSLRRQANGHYRGTYKGRFRDVPIEGTAVCVEKPKREPLPAGFRPVAPDEHPRLLFRKHELPALRARLATPFGQAAFRRMATRGVTVSDGAVFGHVEMGMLYQLTGDERYAQAAIPVVERAMEERDMGFMGLGQIWGPRWSAIAYAYDLCYDAWPAAFRAKVNRYMLRAVQNAAFNMGKFSSCANTHPCSNYYSPIVGGGSMLALALWMAPGGAPPRPGDARLHEPAPLTARPGAGMPVVPLRSNAPFGDWLWAGPVYLPVAVEELAETAAGNGNGAVREGRVFKLGGREYRFQRPPDEVRHGGDIYPWPYVREEAPDCVAAGMVLYTVLENARAGYYRVALPKQGRTHCVLGGLRIPDGAHVRLDAGFYPLLIAFSGDPSMVVPVGARLRFVTDSRKEVDTILTLAAQKVKGEQMVYELDLADHQATGMDGEKINAVNRTFDLMVRGHRLLFGTGGYQSEGEMYHHTAITPVQYAAACWNVFGQTLTPYADARLSVARFLSHGLLDERRNGTAALVWQSFNGGNYHGTPPGFIRAGFRFTPEEYRPALLWLWNRMAGVDEGDPESYVRLLDNADVVQTFVNYPLDPKTGLCSIKPRHPDEAFPKTWRCEDKGLYVFRNRWRDKGDIVLQVYANQLMSKGHGQPDAGGVRLHGLGRDWTNDSSGKGGAYRWLQNVVVLPPDVGMKRATGVATAWGGETNGSGRVSINMDLVYKGVRGHSAVGIWPADPIPPGEVRGVRAVAADYSGKCGAPALFVFVDKIEGGPERAWLWNPPGSGDLRVDTEKNTFTIRQGKASLRAVFVTPCDTVVRSPGTINVRDFSTKEAQALRKKDRHYQPEPSPMEVPIAVKAAPGESFFAVMTLQEGPAPEVKVVKGAGLDAVVRVGGRQVRFDGANVLIEDAETGGTR